MNVYQKLNNARAEFHTLKLEKSGHNKFAGYYYFELGDFLIPAMQVFAKHGLCGTVSFNKDFAKMCVVNVDKPDEYIPFESPMGSAALKGCHEVQNIGAVETYQRRYLWVAALEIVEHDALDSSEPLKPDASKAKQPEPRKVAGIPDDVRANPKKEAFDALAPDWKTYIIDMAAVIENLFEQSGAQAAAQEIAEAAERDKWLNEHRIALEYKLSSKARTAISAVTKVAA